MTSKTHYNLIIVLTTLLMIGFSMSFNLPNLLQVKQFKKPFKWRESHKGLDCITEVIRTFNLGDTLKQKRSDTVETEIVEEGITHSLDVATVLLEYFQWPAQQRNQISKCNLNMKGPLERCNQVYGKDPNNPGQGNCELIFEKFEDSQLINSSIKTSTDMNDNKQRSGGAVPFVSRKCPPTYKRYGCCKCMKTCDSVHMHPRNADGSLKSESLDRNLYCNKPESYKSEKFTDASKCTSERGCEVYADQFYVEKCREGFTRVGADLCMAVCPHGWPDLGEQCLKVGTVEVIPFPWMVGDEENYDSERQLPMTKESNSEKSNQLNKRNTRNNWMGLRFIL